MKKVISLLIISILFISSCSPTTDKDKKIIELSKKVEELTTELEKIEQKEETKKKVEMLRETSNEKTQEELKLEKELEESKELVARLKIQVKNLIITKNEVEKKNEEMEKIEEKIEIPEEKLLDIKFYAQAINGNFKDPYQDFCEEASILNGYYYLLGMKPNLENYDKDLWKMKKFEDENFKGGYVSTTLQQNVELLKAFQGNDQKVFAEIIENPTIEIIKENIAKGNPIVIPTYGRGLGNPYFTGEGPTYHNLLIKGYKGNVFITNEVGTSRGESYEYNQKIIIDNIFNYDPDLYPNRFKEGKKEIMVLYKK